MFRLQKIAVTGDPSGSELLAVARLAEGPRIWSIAGAYSIARRSVRSERWRIHEWQAWGHLPSEGWATSGLRPESGGLRTYWIWTTARNYGRPERALTCRRRPNPRTEFPFVHDSLPRYAQPNRYAEQQAVLFTLSQRRYLHVLSFLC